MNVSKNTNIRITPATTPFDGYTEFEFEPRLEQVRTLHTDRPNPLNASEVEHIIDNLDRALDEWEAA